MNCEKCNKEHDGTFGSGRFCSRKCSNRRILSKETKLKISNSIKAKCLIHKRVLSIEAKKNISNGLKNRSEITRKKKIEYWNNISLSECNDVDVRYVRKRILDAANNTCQECGYNKIHPIWKKPPLEIHHKNENKRNNTPENTVVVCLNCHFMIDEHYRFRGRKHSDKTRKELLQQMDSKH